MKASVRKKLLEVRELMKDERTGLYPKAGKRIKIARGRCEMTQGILAGLVGMERSSIAKIEGGTQQMTLHVAVAICEAVGLSIADLVK